MKTLRVLKVEIEVLKPGRDPVIRVQLGEATEDESGNVTQLAPASKDLVRKTSAIADQMITVRDPVTDEDISLSVAAIQMAMTKGIYAWFPSEFDGQMVGDKFQLED